MLHRALRHLAALLALLPALAGAQILIGQTAGFSGPVAAGVKETTDGAKLWIDAVNARGGVNGQKIELLSLDDQFDPAHAAANAKTLIVDKGVVAMFLSRGTPHTEAIRPLLDEHKLALVGPSTGAMSLHVPVNPHVFNVRAPYQREAERAVHHLATIGMTRVAVLHVDDSFGKDAASGAARGFAHAKLEPLLVATFDRAKPDFAAAVDRIVAAEAQAVLFFGSGSAIVDGMKQLRARGSRAQVVTLSNNASSGFVKSLGDMAHGTIVTQVFPSERNLSLPMVKEAVDLAQAKGLAAVSPAMMEGFAAARVLVEGLRRAGPKPTREGVLKALNGMDNVDLGGMKLNFSPTEHTGLNYTELSIIGADGRFIR